MPNCAAPVIFSFVSVRRVALPISVKSEGFFNGGSAGGGRAEAAERSISRAAAPALRKFAYEPRTLPLPPVSCSPNFGSRSACTTSTRRQSQESSSATIIGSDVRTPCPISDLPHQIFTSPPDETSSHALGEKELGMEDPEILRARTLPERWKGKSKAAQAALDDFRKSRRGTIADIDSAPRGIRRTIRQSVSSFSCLRQGRACAGLWELSAGLPARHHASRRGARSPLPSRNGTTPRTSTGGSRSAATARGSAATSLPCAPKRKPPCTSVYQ